MKRQLKVWRTLFSLLLIGAAFPIMAIQSAAEIVSLQGRGEYRLPSDSDWLGAKIKLQLQATSLVRTGDLSSLGLLFIDQTQIRLGANSMFQIKAVETEGKGKTILKLRKGKSWSRSKRKKRSLTVETPSGIAAIHGTDWVIEVDDEGVSTLTTLDGEIKFSNEFGSVTVRKNEQAVAAPGSKPVKKVLVTPKERTQWISNHTARLESYPALKTQTLSPEMNTAVTALEADDFASARPALEQAVSKPNPPAAAWLLLTDLSLMEGDWVKTLHWLEQGGTAYPDDTRFESRQVRLLMLQDQMVEAKTQLDTLLSQHPNDTEATLTRGDLAQLEGDFREAITAFSNVTSAQPRDARGWLGAGIVWSERNHYKPAHNALSRAVELDPGLPGALGELAALETQADQLQAAEQHYQDALTAQPDDFVALTGLGVLRLKQGNPEAALEALLKAAVIKPNYARALLYTAVAYYQLDRTRHALDLLALAAEADPRDPLPHLMESLIHQDQIKPMAAIKAARRAQERMPFLKSMDQLAHDSKGSANAGSALALMGLESWANSYAQDAYLPFWAGSHLFLANRYQGRFLRESELMQGYLTDPVFFGSSPRNQSLVQRPGQDFALGTLFQHSDQSDIAEPTFVANGFNNEQRPWAYFVEGIGTAVEPGKFALGARATNVTAAFGIKPTPDLGIFLFGNYFKAKVDNPGEIVERNLNGYEGRLDAGLRYRFSPDNQIWTRVGISRSHSSNQYWHPVLIDGKCAFDPFTGSCETELLPGNEDFAIRHIFTPISDHQVSIGMELGQGDFKTVKLSDGVSQFTTGPIHSTLSGEENERDRSQMFYLSDRWRINRDLLVQLDISHSNYRKSRGGINTFTSQGSPLITTVPPGYWKESGIYPRLGFAYNLTSEFTVRGAYQNWLRPFAPHGLAPVATAGVPLDDQWVLPGGELERGRFQIDWELNDRTFTSLWYDHSRVTNLSDGFGSVMNQRTSLAEIGRLQQEAFENLFGIQTPEGKAYFAKGEARSFGIQASRIISDHLSIEAGYIRSKSENLSKSLQGFSLPLVPKHQLSLGMTWFPISRLRVQGQAIYRSERFRDELHTALLDSGWEGTGVFTWSQPNRDFEIKGYAAGLFNHDKPVNFGIKALWRF